MRILHRLFRCQGPEIDGVYAARSASASYDADPAHHATLAFLGRLIAVTADQDDRDRAFRLMPRLLEPVAAP